MPALYAITLFSSAFLLFLIQPLFAKLVLPLLGGSPGVWNTCMVFFQSALLAGYAYAHFVSRRFSVTWQILLQAIILVAAFALLPIQLGNGSPPTSTTPIFWLLKTLAVAVGVPFVVLATTAPLLQRWYARIATHRDPYLLYSASNAGSLLALLAYPVAIEPVWTLGNQSAGWRWGFALYGLCVVVCAMALWQQATRSADTDSVQRRSAEPAPAWRRRLFWLLLAFVPSSLLLSVTTYLTTDLAAIPLLWIIPLALYLLTFIIAFARRGGAQPFFLARWLPLVLLVVACTLITEATEPITLLLVVHLGAFFFISLFCHARLAADRPSAAHLTEFYLWMSGGGVLGGIFNALLAPVIFSGLVEYPLILIVAALLRQGLDETDPAEKDISPTSPFMKHVDDMVGKRLGKVVEEAAAALSVAVLLGGLAIALRMGLRWRYPDEPEPLQLRNALVCLPVVLAYFLAPRPVRYALGLAAVLLVGALSPGIHGRLLDRERSFFGIHRVMIDPTGHFRQLVHGNTIHGRQSLDPAQRREPLSYYHRMGPIGQVFTYGNEAGILKNVGIVGLGAGSLAAYGQAGQTITYYEIDPVVKRIAMDDSLFTFMTDSKAKMNVVLGDARLTLAGAPDGSFDLLVLDAFTSDAIPIHLMTREAMQIYKRKLAPEGILAINISNRYLDLEPVVARLAK
ncbi:MAG TPA: fused MFS/spermidine synthase, partial [Gemmataceae bacterium]|nr:fused MFS/spermidine synthase [Gemmataceae bacterium]